MCRLLITLVSFVVFAFQCSVSLANSDWVDIKRGQTKGDFRVGGDGSVYLDGKNLFKVSEALMLSPLSPSKEFVVALDWDYDKGGFGVFIIKLKEKKIVAKGKGSRLGKSVSWAPDERYLLVPSGEGQLLCLDIQTGIVKEIPFQYLSKPYGKDIYEIQMTGIDSVSWIDNHTFQARIDIYCNFYSDRDCKTNIPQRVYQANVDVSSFRITYQESKPPVVEFPDGLVGSRYSFVISSEKATPPYKVTLTSDTLPPGLKFDERTGAIEGEPKEPGVWSPVFRVTDAKGKRETFWANIRVWRMLTVGDHGKFKGLDGLQMALNMTQNMDEIRIEKGMYEGSELSIPENKGWEHGIKISGGWNETFTERETSSATILDSGAKGSILKISHSKGKVFVEKLTFRNSKHRAVMINRAQAATFTNCLFTDNSGGAVSGDATFIDCTFTNNSSSGGGAVSGNGTFTNCTFMNNSASIRGAALTGGYGGAVLGDSTFTNCTFRNNSANRGGAINGYVTLINCTFENNSATAGGALYGNGTLINCTFMNNSSNSGGAVVGFKFWQKALTFTNCIFINNSAKEKGGAVGADRIHPSFVNGTFYGNKAKEGGAIYGEGDIVNSIFFKNMADGKDNDITVSGMMKVDYSLLNHLKGAADYGANNIMGDPKFMDPDNGDLHLRSDSPCINTGKNMSMDSPVDLDGKRRMVGGEIGGRIDMGAYEWQGAGE